MKSLLIAMVLAASSVWAASPEADYFAARDGYTAKFSSLSNARQMDDGTLRQHDEALAALTKMMRSIVGPVAIEGFPAEGKISLDSLFQGDLGFGLIDGLVYASADGRTQIVVTTEPLLAHWLVEHKDWWGPKIENVPQQAQAALKSEAFYTQALVTDSAFSKYAELPVRKPAGAAFAYAMLIARTQSLGPRTPDELLVAVIASGRVFVVSAPAGARIAPIAACRQIWKDAEQQAIEKQNAYIRAQSKDENLTRQSDRLEEEGDAAFRRCFAARAPADPSFAALARQAQGFVDRLPAN